MIFLNLHFIYTYCNYKNNEHFLDSINMKFKNLVKSEGEYATCFNDEPHCEYTDDMGDTQWDNCTGVCRKWDYFNARGDVSFCCEFSHGQHTQRHCCFYDEACTDNGKEKDDCSYW